VRNSAALAAVLAASAAAAQDDDCLISTAAITQPVPKFADYPAPAMTIRRPAAPVLAGREARAYRTMLRDGAKKGPNFAGRFTLVAWGCGASCVYFAVVDALTGRVTFDPRVRTLDASHAAFSDGAGADGEPFRFRRDSRLLITLGAPNEDQARDGAGFYEWAGGRFRLLKFIPRKDACKVGG
jgi:hypothetical protein